MLSKFHAYFNLQANPCKLVEIKGHDCYSCSVTFVSTISLKETCMSLTHISESQLTQSSEVLCTVKYYHYSVDIVRTQDKELSHRS